MVSRVVFQPLCSLSQWQVKDVGASKNDNSQAFEAGTVPKASLLFPSQFREVKKASSSLTRTAGFEQKVQSLSPTAKGFSRMWFQKKFTEGTA